MAGNMPIQTKEVKIDMAENFHFLVTIIGESIEDFRIDSIKIVDEGRERELEGWEDWLEGDVREWVIEEIEKEKKENGN